jgi:hypothetical protein
VPPADSRRTYRRRLTPTAASVGWWSLSAAKPTSKGSQDPVRKTVTSRSPLREVSKAWNPCASSGRHRIPPQAATRYADDCMSSVQWTGWLSIESAENAAAAPETQRTSTKRDATSTCGRLILPDVRCDLTRLPPVSCSYIPLRRLATFAWPATRPSEQLQRMSGVTLCGKDSFSWLGLLFLAHSNDVLKFSPRCAPVQASHVFE